MKRNPYYTLCEIDGISYLLPFGQGIADFNHGIQINESGVFIWNALQEAATKEALLKRLAKHYQADAAEIPLLKQDLSSFLFLLNALGIVEKDWTEPSCANMPSEFLQIGPICIRLVGPQAAFSEAFQAYRTTACSNPDLTIELRNGVSESPENGTLLLQNEELTVWEQSDRYRLLFPNSRQLAEAYISKDGTFACIYQEPPYTDDFVAELFHAIRFLYLYTAAKHGCYALHSASIRYRGKAWLFSGHSGMGKSTHTGLWKQLYDTPILNGDLNLLSLSDGIPVIYGIPWCGTSGLSTTQSCPLGGIILLKQAKKDKCQELSEDQKALLIMQRLISPSWTAKMLRHNLDFCQRLSKKTAVCQLQCTKENSAVYTMKAWIDERYPLKK